MKKCFYSLCILILFASQIVAQSNTYYTVTMSSSTNNSTAFTANGLLGTDNSLTYYIHWDATYLYLGWSGGNTNYSSDLYYAAIDTDPSGTNGSSSSIENVSFATGAQLPDYYVVYENNSSFYGAPVTNGNSFEIWQASGGSWSWVSRTAGDDGTSSQIVFSNTVAEVRLRIAWSTLGFSPGTGNSFGVIMWTNNANGDYLWSSFPSSNPTGSTPQTLTNQIVYSNSGSGVNPSTDYSGTALPVELTSFTASLNGNGVLLNWQTATEVNNYGFEVQRSSGKSAFSVLGFVQGHGNSNSPKQYTYTDGNVEEGAAYIYRLKQIDVDGAFEYSDEVRVSMVNNSKSLVLKQNFPNPFNPSTAIKFSFNKATKAKLTVYNSLGQTIAELFNRTVEAGKIYSVNFDGSKYSSGIYFYKLITPEKTAIKKMLLIK